ncbi:hypothetical protein ACFPOE_21220 [Caenimonas terrae]|uniref:Tetratricopeptide repeat protein n=1 Tax=Caenimonas terrae TaxID=696074 RepID=A0ABW0NLP5_9BURK
MNASPDSAKLAQANADHDATPSTAADLLRQVEPGNLAEAELPTYIFLLNHVLGEKLSAWDEALTRHERVLALPAVKPGYWRQAGAAALAAGNAQALGRFSVGYAKATDADLARASEVIQLGAAVHQAPSLPAGEAARLTGDVLAALDAPFWRTGTELDSAVASGLNNLASGLMERPASDLADSALGEAVSRCAALAHAFWRRAGTWVHAERALYLRATVATALGDFQSARRHCSEALALLDENDLKGEQPVDRAFLELERAHACRRLGRADEAEVAAQRSEQLARSFQDPGLRTWFDSRRASLAASDAP